MTSTMFIITSNNKTPQSLRSHSCLHLLQCRNNGGLMTAHSGGTMVKRYCQSNNRGRAWVCVTSHRQVSEIGLIWARGNNLTRLKYKHWVDFYHYRMVVYTLPTHIQLKQLVKVHVASNDPFQKNHMFLLIQWKLIESYIVLGPTDFHCMDKISLNGLQNIFCSTEDRKSNKFWMTQGEIN